MSELARQLALSMESPVWAAVRKPAPWAKQSGPGSVLAA
jgi:nitrogenase molybdenum-cofactor synthesis protein NifE